MRGLTLPILLLYSSFVLCEEDCSLENIGLTDESNIAEKLFFTGTCNYRNKNYAESARLWKKLASLDNVDTQYREYQIDTLNNLGYLTFFGYGLKEDKESAISYWNKAISLGHYESEYHLCHAYADKEVATYDPIKAKPHCEKARLIYKGIENKDEDAEVILNHIEKYISGLDE